MEQISELEQFKRTMELLEKDSEEEILASVGKGVFMKAKRDKDQELFVEVGAGVIVRKTPKEARKIIEGQIKKFNEARVQLNSQLQEHASQFQKMLKEVEKLRK